MQKLTMKQEQSIQEKVKNLQAKIEQQCRKHTEEINKYKEHVTELTSRHWEVCDKLLAEKQEKEGAFKQMKEMSLKFNNDIKDLHQRQVLSSLNKTARYSYFLTFVVISLFSMLNSYQYFTSVKFLFLIFKIFFFYKSKY